MIDITAAFVTFFAVVDPIGTVPVFIAVTSQFDEKARRRIALVATVAAAAILLFFVVPGELILRAMSIPLSAFQIAGGIVLFVFALTMRVRSDVAVSSRGPPAQAAKIRKHADPLRSIRPPAVWVAPTIRFVVRLSPDPD